MAIDQSDLDFDDDAPQSGVANVLATTFWAAASLGVFVGALIWAYGLGVRNPADVPALRAAVESYKRPPADPGGLRVPDQGRNIYSEVSGAAATPAAPARPTDGPERPTAEDIEVAAKEIGSDAFVALVAEAARDKDAPARKRVVDLDLFEIRPGSTEALSPTPPAYPPNIGRGSEPLPPNAAGADAAPKPSAARPAPSPRAAGAPSADEIVTDTTGAAARSDRLASVSAPAPRAETPPSAGPETPERGVDAPPSNAAAGEAPPSNDAPAAAEVPPGAATESASATPPAAAPARDATPAGAPGGVALSPAPAPSPAPRAAAVSPDGRAYQVQLAALESVADVKRRWSQIRRSQGALLDGLSLDVQPVTVGGSELYRLRLDGVGARENAARLCSELRKRGVDCFVAVKR